MPPGELRADLEAARSGSVVAPLSHLGVLKFEGEDAASFLQGQLTCDAAAIGESASYGGYCSPQGRMLASFLLWRGEAAFFMALARDIAPAIRQRLGRFVLRAKVRVADVSATVALIGCSGPDAAAALAEPAGSSPERALQVVRRSSDETLVRLDESRFLLAAACADRDARVAQLSVTLKRVDASAWQWLDVRRGIPWITAATQDRFVPQMVNLELIGGVSFSKGCYTGQEIVARTQHRGKVKRRMFLANVSAEGAPGDELVAEDLGDQTGGMVINAAPAPDGGSDMLAVAPIGSREQSTVHLKSRDGPALRFLPLPYAVA